MRDKKYVIINANEVNSIDFSKVDETSANMLRYNNDNTQTFVKFTGDTPSFLEGKTQYTLSEIKEIINAEKGSWSPEEDPIDTTGNIDEED
jgi:uncharacterized protein YjbJ (UPF0337 family)